MKIVALSDIHGQWDGLEIPSGDVLVFAGDTLRHGTLIELAQFNAWLEKLPHQHKLVIAGNHDRCFEREHSLARGLLTNATYLEDEEIVIDDIKFYGSPWTPQFYDWAFMLERGSEIAEKWKNIPRDTDVLITHGPPHRILDAAYRRDPTGAYSVEIAGCEALREVVNKLPLKAHIFGHIHRAHGTEGVFHNVAICNEDYDPVNPITEIELKQQIQEMGL